MDDVKPVVKSRRGFASMSSEQRSAISSLGGKAAQARGTAHQYTSDEAREAGRKGGKAAAASKRASAIAREQAEVQRER